MSEKNPINVLMHEHGIIQQLEPVIASLKGLWVSDVEAYKSSITKILRFLKDYSDGYHHNKEEEVLFPALTDHPDFILEPVLDELLEHHENFREYAADINIALNEQRWADVQAILEKYYDQLLDHIAIENDELFIMAENLFSEKELEEMFFRFADKDRELGESRKIELEQDPEKIASALV
ncbi:MAG: hemerythrin domain-containing protein [Bacteroidia bacterium]|nr:hemerythrin domain-containing protein [Bacteroidia bacterium]